jgi:hypothetical protein
MLGGRSVAADEDLMVAAIVMVWPTAIAVAYILATIAAWACLSDRRMRLVIISFLCMAPAALFASTAYQLTRVREAQAVFARLCEDVRPPSIVEPVRRVPSINIVRPDNTYENAAAGHHSSVAFPPELVPGLILGGAEPYEALEVTQWARTELIHARNDRTARVPHATSRITLSLRDVRPHSPYISSGVFVLKDNSANRAIFEVPSYVLDTPDVLVLGGAEAPWSAAFARKRSCPNAREIADTIKRAARPN